MLKLACLLISFALLAAPAFGATPYVHGGVFEAVVDADTLFVGGSFESVNGQPTGAMAVFGAQDAALRRAFTGITGSGERNSVEMPPLHVAALESDGAGGWFAGGTFSQVDGLPRDSLAHLRADGSVDPTFRADVDGEVTALARRGNTLYVGGRFLRSVSGSPSGSLVALDATTGARLPFADAVGSGEIVSLEVAGDRLYVAAGALAVLDAVTGTRVPWQANANHRGVSGVAVQGDVVYVAMTAHFEGPGAVALDRANGALLPIVFEGVEDPRAVVATSDVVVWQGADRGLVASDPATGADRGWFTGQQGSAVRPGLAIDGNRLYATMPHVRVFDLRDGSSVPWDAGIKGGFAAAIAAADGEVAVSGPLGPIGATARENLAAFDVATGAAKPLSVDFAGRPPDPFRPPDPPLVRAVALVDGVLYVGGHFETVNGVPQRNLVALDPSTGALLPFPSVPFDVLALDHAGSTLYVGGGGPFMDGLRAFDLTTGTERTWDVDVDCAVNDVTVVGDSLYAGGCFDGRLARFDLQTLSRRPTPVPDGPVEVVIGDGAGGVWLGGDFAGGVAHLDASGRLLPGAPTTDRNVTALHLDGDVLTIGGRFNRLQGQARPNLGQVRVSDGSVTPFAPEPGGRPNTFAALATGELYVGGWFNWTFAAFTGGLARFGATATPIVPTAQPEPLPADPGSPSSLSPGASPPPAAAQSLPRVVSVPRIVPRLVATRRGIQVRLSRPTTRRATVRVLLATRTRTVLGRATLKPGARTATLTLSRKGRALLARSARVVIVELAGANGTKTTTRARLARTRR